MPQQLTLFSGNIVDNIALGDREPNMEKIMLLCKELGILDFIEHMPDHFQTQLGENGVGLSGGEKQRLAIARALYRDPQVLILDEATSSLNSESEQYVQQAIANFNGKGNTVILIAHRLSTVMHADKIVMLQKGVVIEEGTHQSLFNPGSHYYAMWEKQVPKEIRTN